MNATVKFAVLAALGIVGPWVSQRSAAADASDPSADRDTLETIVVTAEKRAEPLREVPMSITALTGASLDQLADRSFADYASMVPGLSLNSSQPGLTRLTLRGQNAGGVGSTVAVYIDESPFGSSSALLNGSVLSGDFDTWDLQRVEVLRGPQGTLYGANSEGGLLKFVTQAPVLGSFSGAAEINGETVDHGGTGGDVHVTLNLPVGDKLALRISGFDADVPGYINDPGRGLKDVNDGHKEGGRVSLLAQPFDDLTIRLTAVSQQSKYNATNQVDVDPVSLRPVHGDLTQERFVSEPSSFKYENYNATIDWNAGPFSVLSTTSYGILNSDLVTDATSAQLGGPGVTLGDILAGALGGNFGGYEDNNAGLKKLTQEIRLSSPSSNALEWQVGGYFTRETGALVQHLNAVTLPDALLVAGLPSLEFLTLSSTYKEWAGFADVTYHFSPLFDLQAGGRYSRNEQSASESISGLLVPSSAFTTPSNGNVFTWSVAPRFHFDANNMLYARAATGYRPGGPNALPPIAPPDVPRQYGADKTLNFEVGERSTLLDGALSVDVAAFYVRWTDIQLFEIVDNTGINGNGGKARSQGLEWTLGYVPVKGLTINWTGAFTDANLTSEATSVNGNPGDPLPWAPKWSTGLDGEYDWSAFAGFQGFVGGTWSYVGTRSSDFASSAVGGQVGLPHYNSVDARVGIDNKRYRITVYGKNLGDSRGVTNYVNTGAPGNNGDVTYIQPRTIGVTLSAKF
jgi:iron complex outermembrane recepter protein